VPTTPPSATVPPAPTTTPTPPAPSPTPCTVTFTDVPPTSPFYVPIQYLACRGVVSGYGAEFRPYNTTTRGQIAKMIVLGFGYPLTCNTQAFADVPGTHPFYCFIETLVARPEGIISGYTCGSPGEPCDPQNRPYFRPANPVTRGQLAKMLVLARGWTLANPPVPTFADTPLTHPFYPFVETAAARVVISGYDCGGPGEPCDPQNRPYFRPGADATRGQVSKMLYITLVTP
jgi:hypothetical protein